MIVPVRWKKNKDICKDKSTKSTKLQQFECYLTEFDLRIGQIYNSFNKKPSVVIMPKSYYQPPFLSRSKQASYSRLALLIYFCSNREALLLVTICCIVEALGNKHIQSLKTNTVNRPHRSYTYHVKSLFPGSERNRPLKVIN